MPFPYPPAYQSFPTHTVPITLKLRLTQLSMLVYNTWQAIQWASIHPSLTSSGRPYHNSSVQLP
jgi:hypothetical protein